MSLLSLLDAAKIVEQREKQGNHIQILQVNSRKDKKYTKRSQTYRATHNQLEKNRRAHLRDCLVSLRDLVPSTPDQTKVTTLSLLQSAKQYIKVLESHDKEAEIMKRKLHLEQQRLRKKIALLLNSDSNGEQNIVLYKSDNSTSSNSSCDEEIDVESFDETGYGSADERFSTSSTQSDSCHSVL